MKSKVVIGLTAVLVAGWAVAGFAFRADDQVLQSAPKASLSVAASAARSPSATQQAAVETIPGATVNWDEKTGVPSSIRAQNLETVNLGAKGLALKAGASYEDRAVAVLDRLSTAFRIRDAAQEFAAYRVDADNLNFHHVRVEQRYNGLRVFGSDLIVHFNAANTAYQVNGRYVSDIAVDTDPALEASDALAVAQANLARQGNAEGTPQGEPELVIYANNGATPRLAYELTIVTRSPEPGNWRYWIDAQSGAILNSYNNLPKASATILGYMLYGEGGSLAYMTGWYDGSSGRFFMYDGRRLIRNADTTCSFYDSGGYAWRWYSSWYPYDAIEVSAGYNFEAILSYYRNVHSRNSYDNYGTLVNVYTHAYYGSYSDNAYWSPSDQAFFFYDGHNYGGLTVLDVAGHEFTHAVTEKTADLVYQDESGALNESFSDIFGAAIEFYYQPDGRGSYPYRAGGGYSDWLLAEDCTYPVAIAMRDMRNPGYYNQPSRYHGTSWYYGSGDNGGVHVNSGVQNHMFYLLAEGGRGYNDGISYSVTGIGIANAARVAYRALTVYCGQNTDHSAAKNCWLWAASDINSSFSSSVENAWKAVTYGGGGGGGPNINAYYACLYAYYGYYYANCALYYYASYDSHGYLYWAREYSHAGYVCAYWAYVFDYYYGSDYGYAAYYAYYASLLSYYGYLHADYAYRYETGDPYSYLAYYCDYYASYYSYLVYLVASG